MKKALLLAPLALGLMGASKAPSSEVVIASKQGECTLLVIANRSATQACGDKLVTLAYGRKLVSIVFAAQDGRLLSFRGIMGARGGGQGTLKVQRITTVAKLPTPAVVRPASGACVITAFSPTRDRIECSATTPGVRYEGQFVTTGA
jgi:hypothetical protein